ncbi:hypothetical protein [Amycolatopsis rhizosphaerae]|uniref:hypothetical protein n=1 Tax=Amycolatopsis rhizosphaerae TaxID=2053003 RepID=UPI001643E4CC|nr:hypothetical protein [Amycolatopsis rhizosphaerae]
MTVNVTGQPAGTESGEIVNVVVVAMSMSSSPGQRVTDNGWWRALDPVLGGPLPGVPNLISNTESNKVDWPP